MTLTEFLAARFDEDERNAREALAQWADTHFAIDPGSLVIVRFHRTHDPARVLREVEAGRAILRYLTTADGHEPRALMVAESEELLAQRGLALPAEWLLRELGAGWSDHPDYDPAWGIAGNRPG